MATGKEKQQAERLATNAENQRRQDEFGLAQARLFASASEGKGGDGREAAAETRKLHAEDIYADQVLQTDNDSSTDDDNMVSTAVEGEGKKDYIERNVVVKDISVDAKAPGDAAYDGEEKAEKETPKVAKAVEKKAKAAEKPVKKDAAEVKAAGK